MARREAVGKMGIRGRREGEKKGGRRERDWGMTGRERKARRRGLRESERDMQRMSLRLLPFEAPTPQRQLWKGSCGDTHGRQPDRRSVKYSVITANAAEKYGWVCVCGGLYCGVCYPRAVCSTAEVRRVLVWRTTSDGSEGGRLLTQALRGTVNWRQVPGANEYGNQCPLPFAI